jgi:hypothetical protein
MIDLLKNRAFDTATLPRFRGTFRYDTGAFAEVRGSFRYDAGALAGILASFRHRTGRVLEIRRSFPVKKQLILLFEDILLENCVSYL